MYDSKNSFTEVLTTGVKAQAITTQAASTNSINLDKANIAFVGGKGQVLKVRCTVAATVSGAATGMSIRLESSTVTGFGTSLKQVVEYNFVNAQMVAGALLINQQIPVQKYQQFIRLYFNPVGGDVTMDTASFVAYLDDVPETADVQQDNVEVA